MLFRDGGNFRDVFWNITGIWEVSEHMQTCAIYPQNKDVTDRGLGFHELHGPFRSEESEILWCNVTLSPISWHMNSVQNPCWWLVWGICYPVNIAEYHIYFLQYLRVTQAATGFTDDDRLGSKMTTAWGCLDYGTQKICTQSAAVRRLKSGNHLAAALRAPNAFLQDASMLRAGWQAQHWDWQT